MAFEVQSDRVGSSCDHRGEVYCKAVGRVDSDPDDTDVAAHIQKILHKLFQNLSAPFVPYDDKLVASYLKSTG